jgi:hypothetical protein
MGKEWTQIIAEHLLEDREKWKSLCHKKTHPAGNVNAATVDNGDDNNVDNKTKQKKFLYVEKH